MEERGEWVELVEDMKVCWREWRGRVCTRVGCINGVLRMCRVSGGERSVFRGEGSKEYV